MTNPTQRGPAPEVELDPAAEQLTRHVSTVTSTALAATQHAMQSATLRAYLARDAASTEARAHQRALQAHQQIARAAEVTDAAADRAGVATAMDPASAAGAATTAAATTEQWTAYADGAEAAALGGRGVSVPPQQVLTHVEAQALTASPPKTPAADATTAAEPGIATGTAVGLQTGIDAGLHSGTTAPAPTPGIEP